MAFTTINDVRLISQCLDSETAAVYDDPVILTGTDDQHLKHTGVVSGSEVVTNTAGTVTYTKDVDYTIEYDTGVIARIEEGAISDGQEVLVDYDFYINHVTDELIQFHIDTAHQAILDRLESGYESSTARELRIGEAEITTAYLFRSLANLHLHQKDTVYVSAREDDYWRQARDYEVEGWARVEPFLQQNKTFNATVLENKSYDETGTGGS